MDNGTKSPMQSDMFTLQMGARLWPARLDSAQTAKLLGFREHDIPVLVAYKKLRPLGKPAQNASKHFAFCAIVQLAGNEEWLHKATQTLYDYWKGKNVKKTRSGAVELTGRPMPSPEGEPQVSLSE